MTPQRNLNFPIFDKNRILSLNTKIYQYAERFIYLSSKEKGLINKIRENCEGVYNIEYMTHETTNQLKITSGQIGRQILSGNYNYFSRKLKDGTTIRSDSIDKIRETLESLTPSQSKKKALDYLDYYLQFRGLKDNPTNYHYDWDKLFWNHCYDLLILQSGMDYFTGNPLPDDSEDLIRHHHHYDKSSINLIDLTLMTKTSHNQYSHPTRMGKSKDPKGDRKKILDVISSISSKNPIKPKHWTNYQWSEYLKRRNYYENNGEYNFFRKFYPRFYN